MTELFIRGRILKIYLVFIAQSYFAVPKNIRLNSMLFFIIKFPKKRELQQILLNHPSDICLKDFRTLYKECTENPSSFLNIDATLTSDKSSLSRKNLSNGISN